MTERNSRNRWHIIPSAKPEDNLYNRRLLSYYSLVFSAIWFHEILVVLVIGMILKQPLDGAIVAGLVGVPASLAGLGFWKYLEACKVEDVAKIEGTPNHDHPEGKDIPPT